MQNLFDIVEKEIKNYKKTVIIGHIQPDGDCLGSSLGMYNLIKDNYGSEAIVVNQPIKRYEFLGSWTLPYNTVYDEDTFVIHVDNASAPRSADPDFIKAGCILKVDHHMVVDSYGTYNVEETLSSCCEIIVKHALDKGLKISQDAARALYCGMVTDTGRFMYPSVNGDTLRRGAALLDTGFDMSDLFAALNARTMDNVNYIATCYQELKFSEKGVAWMYITQDIIDRYHLTPDMVSEALSTMRDIKGHPVMVLFADLGDLIRVEFRSDRIKLNQIAAQFGGGGHAFAAGARLTTKEEIPQVIEALETLL